MPGAVDLVEDDVLPRRSTTVAEHGDRRVVRGHGVRQGDLFRDRGGTVHVDPEGDGRLRRADAAPITGDACYTAAVVGNDRIRGAVHDEDWDRLRLKRALRWVGQIGDDRCRGGERFSELHRQAIGHHPSVRGPGDVDPRRVDGDACRREVDEAGDEADVVLRRDGVRVVEVGAAIVPVVLVGVARIGAPLREDEEKPVLVGEGLPRAAVIPVPNAVCAARPAVKHEDERSWVRQVRRGVGGERPLEAVPDDVPEAQLGLARARGSLLRAGHQDGRPARTEKKRERDEADSDRDSSHKTSLRGV